jgi:hypothetical protein
VEGNERVDMTAMEGRGWKMGDGEEVLVVMVGTSGPIAKSHLRE